MPVDIVFDPPNAGLHPDARPLRLGPYSVAQIVGDELFALDAELAFVLASRTTEGVWVVNGLEGLTFRGVRFFATTGGLIPRPDRAEEPLKADEE
jgi:hypothetical protein